MKIISLIKVALKNIVSNKLRSCLTMLGLIIGIASVIVLVGIGNGASENVNSQVQGLGTDILTVKISSSDVSLSITQIKEMMQLMNIEAIAPYKNVNSTVSRGTTTSSKASLIATNSNYLTVTNTKLEKGRTLSEIDIENRNKVCILGQDIASTLFSLTDPVGQQIKIDGDNYTVIGVLQEQGSSMGNDRDNTILIPLTTASYLGEDTSINDIYVKVKEESNIEITSTLLSNYIRSNLQIGSDYYSVSSQQSTIEAMEEIGSTLSLLLGGIASISLIVGGIGVMNVMLVSVTERTKEIGIRKALGAKRMDILVQFLMEALVLSIIGGSLGVGAGILIGNIAEGLGYTFTNSFPIILLAFGSSAAIGIVFGIFPSYRAAKLNPIEALRTE